MKGIVRWTVTPAPREEREFRVSCQVEYPPWLVFDMRRKQMESPPSPSPAAAAKAQKRDFEEQLIQIEQEL